MVDDSIFGKMVYKHGWVKTDSISFWGKRQSVIIAAKAYQNRPITKEEQDSYQWFQENIEEISQRSAKEIILYVNRNYKNWKMEWPEAHGFHDVNDVAGVIHLTKILFQRDGTILLLCEVPWDEENGMAVKVYPSFAVGPQDLFL